LANFLGVNEVRPGFLNSSHMGPAGGLLVGWGLTVLSAQGWLFVPIVVFSFNIWRNTKSTAKNQTN